MTEAAKRYGRRHKVLSKQDVNKIHEEWIGKEVLTPDTDEVVNRMRDIMETEINPIAHCEEHEALGRVCYENDGGFSHKLSQGQLSYEEMKQSFSSRIRINASSMRGSEVTSMRGSILSNTIEEGEP